MKLIFAFSVLCFLVLPPSAVAKPTALDYLSDRMYAEHGFGSDIRLISNSVFILGAFTNGWGAWAQQKQIYKSITPKVIRAGSWMIDVGMIGTLAGVVIALMESDATVHPAGITNLEQFFALSPEEQARAVKEDPDLAAMLEAVAKSVHEIDLKLAAAQQTAGRAPTSAPAPSPQN